VKYFGRDNSHCASAKALVVLLLRKQIVLARAQGVFHISKDISATGGGQVLGQLRRSRHPGVPDFAPRADIRLPRL
jgi:hypothetical protein